MELAELKGTEKQVNWAKAIRKDRLKIWQAADPDSFQGVEPMLTQLGASSWWITNKDKSLKEVCSQLQGGAKSEAAGKTAAPCDARVSLAGAEAEVWETVVTATGFSRSGATRDMMTGEIVSDAALPF
jgi:hypothetical protein